MDEIKLAPPKWIQDSDKNVRNLRTYEEAVALKALTQKGLDAGNSSNFKLRIRLRPSGLFDLQVFRLRTKSESGATQVVTQAAQ